MNPKKQHPSLDNLFAKKTFPLQLSGFLEKIFSYRTDRTVPLQTREAGNRTFYIK